MAIKSFEIAKGLTPPSTTYIISRLQLMVSLKVHFMLEIYMSFPTIFNNKRKEYLLKIFNFPPHFYIIHNVNL